MEQTEYSEQVKMIIEANRKTARENPPMPARTKWKGEEPTPLQVALEDISLIECRIAFYEEHRRPGAVLLKEKEILGRLNKLHHELASLYRIQMQAPLQVQRLCVLLQRAEDRAGALRSEAAQDRQRTTPERVERETQKKAMADFFLKTLRDLEGGAA